MAKASGKTYDLILSNPPFGKKSSITIINEEGKADKEAVVYERQDFWTTTSNKQLNFLQQIYTMLSIPGRAAVVVPDNVLFEGGAGEKVRDRLLKQCDVHTLLRLPTGIFYAQGVKANVLFFDKKPGREKAWTEKLWIYDLRTNKHFTLKTNQMKDSDLEDFINCYNPENRFDRTETERFKCYTYDEILRKEDSRSLTYWDSETSILRTEFDYSDTAPKQSFSLQKMIDHEVGIKEPLRRLIIGDIEIITDQNDRFKVIEIRTNSSSWQKKTLSKTSPDLEKVWVEFQVEYDTNWIAFMDINVDILWDSLVNQISFRFNPFRSIPQWYSISNNMNVGVDINNEICEFVFQDVVIERG